MGCQEIEFVVSDWMYRIRSRDNGWALGNTVMKLRFPFNAGYFFTKKLLVSEGGFCSIGVARPLAPVQLTTRASYNISYVFK